MARPATRKSGFTLVELLVVIAIIGVLAGMLLPALSGAKGRAQDLACRSNLKQLAICWYSYVGDYHDLLVPNNSVVFLGSNAPDSSKGVSWCLDQNARTESNASNLEHGLLFPYNTAVGIYHCPADRSTLETSLGAKLPSPRFRSYNMSQSVNGYPEYNREVYDFLPAYKTLSEIRGPGATTSLFVFIDEHEETILDAQFGNPPKGSPYYQPNIWWDIPSDRHNQAANLSFADGHVEHWKWQVRKVFKDYFLPATAAEMGDYQRIQDAMRPWTPDWPPKWL